MKYNIRQIRNIVIIFLSLLTYKSFAAYSPPKIITWGDVQGSPASALDVDGVTGYNQFRMRETYTPSSSADANGNTGDVAWDADYIYIKTGAGWKRTALSTF